MKKFFLLFLLFFSLTFAQTNNQQLNINNLKNDIQMLIFFKIECMYSKPDNLLSLKQQYCNVYKQYRQKILKIMKKYHLTDSDIKNIALQQINLMLQSYSNPNYLDKLPEPLRQEQLEIIKHLKDLKKALS